MSAGVQVASRINWPLLSVLLVEAESSVSGFLAEAEKFESGALSSDGGLSLSVNRQPKIRSHLQSFQVRYVAEMNQH